jgi:hypothetical protein
MRSRTLGLEDTGLNKELVALAPSELKNKSGF